MELKNKTILITGGSTGIGRATAQACIKKGAHLIVMGMHKPDYPCTFLEADVRNETDIASAMKKVKKIDALVVNAGIAHVVPLEKTTTEQMNSLLDTNVKGVFWTCNHAIPKLKKGGCIVTLGSIAGLHSYEGFGMYCATKAAVISMTKSYAIELSDRKIRVNSIAPGIVETALWKKVGMDMSMLKGLLDASLVKRPAQPEEIANAAVFLMQNEFVNGTVLVIDGGELVK
ncbi:MAG: SDR family oxidoreductase [Candidatus Woesearchaeota archaeon]|jgi:NAD(P)-dependent dehydrogenase (short-subunit alcohol dehydrogenase family)